MLKKNLYVICRYWTTEKGDVVKYFTLVCDLGYRKAVLCKDKNTIAELLGIPIAELYEMQDNDIKGVGVID